MDEMELVELPLIGDVRESDIPTPEEYQYWHDRQNRVFYIDYELDEDYALIEFSKVIIQMNIEEKDIPEEDLLPIKIFIHSYGGDLDQANYLCDLLQASRIPIITVAMGAVMSSGFLIFLSGHKRYAFKHTTMLIHSGSAALAGTAGQIDDAQKNYKKQIDAMKQYILERTTIDEKTFNKNKSKDWYLTSDEFVPYGIADAIIDDLSIIL